MELLNDCSQKDCEVSSSVHCLWLASTSGETVAFRVTEVHGGGGDCGARWLLQVPRPHCPRKAGPVGRREESALHPVQSM